jgi:hypothetical protein
MDTADIYMNFNKEPERPQNEKEYKTKSPLPSKTAALLYLTNPGIANCGNPFRFFGLRLS